MSNFVSAEEEEMYGPEFLEIMRKVAYEQAAPLHGEIQNLRSALGHVQQETGQAFLDRMNRELSAIAGDWQALNRHPQFVSWAQGIDALSGQRRATLMQSAWNDGDARRVAEFFRAWGALPDSTPPARGSGHSYLPTGTPGGRPDVALYTKKQVETFYRDCALGRWDTRDELRRKLDADIQLAGPQGRITDEGRPISYVQK